MGPNMVKAGRLTDVDLNNKTSSLSGILSFSSYDAAHLLRAVYIPQEAPKKNDDILAIFVVWPKFS